MLGGQDSDFPATEKEKTQALRLIHLLAGLLQVAFALTYCAKKKQMNKTQKIIIAAMLAAIIIMPLEGYSVLSLDVIMPVAILWVGFFAFGRKK